MAATECYAMLIALALASVSAPGAELVKLEEAGRSSESTRVQTVLKAQGLFLPAAPTGASKAESPRPLALKVEAELDYLERAIKTDDTARPARVVRRVTRAASAINGEVRPSATALRPAVALLVAESQAEGVVVFSPGGPLTRSELELVQGPADPLTWTGLLPARPVGVGDHWAVADPAARSLSSYDTLTRNSLEATLDSVDGDTARVRLRGEVRGSVLGGEGTMACDGSYSFDRRAGRLERLTLRRAETRRPGLVEEGLDVKSTLTITRRTAETPAELSDAALGRLSIDPSREREQLLLKPPGGRYTLVHGRNWHTYWDDNRLSVLKRVDGARLVAQCNLTAGPSAGKGKHQDLAQFRDDVRKGLGSRFVQFLGAGEVGGDPAGGFRYKVGVQGRQGDLDVVWYYYLVASPEGDQLLATFTMSGAQAKAFGDEDETLIGSLRWTEPG